MSTNEEFDGGIDVQGLTPARPGDDRDVDLDELLTILDGLDGVTATEVDRDGCGASGCRRSDVRLWRIDVEGVLPRTLCPRHAVDFTQKKAGVDL